MWWLGLATGCQTHYQRLLETPPSQPLPPRVTELGSVSVLKSKTALFHQPCFTRAELDQILTAAIRAVPTAEFLSDHTLNATLRLYPSARLPVFYRLRLEITAVVARTNWLGAEGSAPPGGR